MVRVLALEIRLTWHKDYEDEKTLVRFWSRVQEPKLMRVVLSEHSAIIWSIIWQSFVMEKLLKLTIGKNKMECSNLNSYYFRTGYESL